MKAWCCRLLNASTYLKAKRVDGDMTRVSEARRILIEWLDTRRMITYPVVQEHVMNMRLEDTNSSPSRGKQPMNLFSPQSEFVIDVSGHRFASP